jgi:hypothetical protein
MIEEKICPICKGHEWNTQDRCLKCSFPWHPILVDGGIIVDEQGRVDESKPRYVMISMKEHDMIRKHAREFE